MAKVKIVLDRKNVSAVLLKSDEIAGYVSDVARQIAASAGSGYTVENRKHAFRAVSNVVDNREDALSREAEEGNLTRALNNFGVGRRYGKYPRRTPKG